MLRNGRRTGFTLIELLVAIAVLAVLATVAAPALNEFIEKSRLRGAAEALHADLTYARSEAVLRNQTITVSFTTGTNWCYGLHNAGTCDCASAGSCSIKSVAGSSYTGTTLTSSYTSIAFDGVQGTVSGTGGTIGTDTIVVGNSIGEAGVKPGPVSVRLCSPSSYTGITGYPSC